MRNTFTVFLMGRLNDKLRTIQLPSNLLFAFRGNLDKGVVSHFYKEGYFIEDTEEQRITKILDCGANIGDETARFLIHYPYAEIVAVEAEPSNFRILERNFELHRNRIHLIHGAIWPVETYLKVISGTSMESFRVIETTDLSNSINAVSIPSIMKRQGWDEVDILKLDIEGAEYELFTKDYEKWIKQTKVLIFEVPDNDRPGTTQTIFRALGADSFNTYICGENLVLIRQGLPWNLKKVIGFKGSIALNQQVSDPRVD